MTQQWRVREAARTDLLAWGAMRAELWPDEAGVGDPAQMLAWLDDPGKAALLALDADDDAIGFAELGLRHDYVNGTTTSPVGFLEGWYVVQAWRGRGVGRALVAAAEDWARARGCSEFASDVLLDNTASMAAHLACGFDETDRVVYFRKALGE